MPHGSHAVQLLRGKKCVSLQVCTSMKHTAHRCSFKKLKFLPILLALKLTAAVVIQQSSCTVEQLISASVACRSPSSMQAPGQAPSGSQPQLAAQNGAPAQQQLITTAQIQQVSSHISLAAFSAAAFAGCLVHAHVMDLCDAATAGERGNDQSDRGERGSRPHGRRHAVRTLTSLLPRSGPDKSCALAAHPAWLADCRYQSKLQASLMFLASVADAQPQPAPASAAASGQ